MKSPERGSVATKKAKAARDEKTGRFQFEHDLEELVKLVRAVTDLEPVIAASVLSFKQLGDDRSAEMAGGVGAYLAVLKDSAVRALSVDPESVKELKKKRLEAERLGNATMEEVERTSRLVSDWSLKTVTPLSLAQEHPAVLMSAMAVALHVGVRVHSDSPLELPSEVVQLLAKPKDGDS